MNKRTPLSATSAAVVSGVLLAAVLLAPHAAPAAESVPQSARAIPIARETDLVVVGGTLAAVAAATEAADNGASVLLVAPRLYLGEDLAATLHLWLDEGESASGRLTSRLFSAGRTTTPLRVKKTLEAALLEAKVDFLLGCYPTDVLRDGNGQPAGIVIANRAGRQAIVAKAIIDATPRATVAKLAGAEHQTWPRGKHPCRRVVLGGRSDSQVEPARSVPAGVKATGGPAVYYDYALELDFGDGSFPALADAEQEARDQTYRSGQLRAAERLTMTPLDPIRGQTPAEAWKGLAPHRIGHFLPRNVQRVYVAGGAADVPRAAAAELMRPASAEALGRILGKAAAKEASTRPAPSEVHLPGTLRPHEAGGDVAEVLRGLRPTDRQEKTVPSAASTVPILARVDVLVIGGGTSGACAAIGAARQGAKVLVVEYQEGLGGVGTLGLIGRPYHGRNVGFTREVPFCDSQFNTEDKMEWFRREIRRAGGRIWLGALGCGAYVEGQRVRGGVVATPLGRGVVLADVVIDATGNADVAVAAGAEARYGGDGHDIAMQGAGLPIRPLGDSHVNTDYLLVDESDLVDTRRAVVGVRLATGDTPYDVGPFIQTRERRRVVGDHWLTYVDQIAGRTYPDSIVLSASDYDTHAYPLDPYFALFPHTEKTRKANHPAPGGSCYTPYRCLLPRGLEGILVIGLGISMDADAAALVRMQRDMHNQGYAAGVAAAMAVANRCPPRQIDVRALQKHLVAIGNLPESVLTDEDSFPLPEEELRAAVRALGEDDREAACRALAVILAHRPATQPLLKEALANASGTRRLHYAKVLGFFGDRDVVPILVEALDKVDQWDAKIYQGKMAEYAHLPTEVDSLILALGATGDRRATPAILRKLQMLDAEVTLSHHRAVALALEQIADPAAAEPLARLLAKPGMRGHAMTGIEPLHNREVEKRRRLGPLREIVLARALYRCGDYQGLGRRILTEYQHDLRGLFARHATAVLAGQNPSAAGPDRDK